MRRIVKELGAMSVRLVNIPPETAREFEGIEFIATKIITKNGGNEEVSYRAHLNDVLESLSSKNKEKAKEYFVKLLSQWPLSNPFFHFNQKVIKEIG